MDSNRLEYNITYLICGCTFEDPLPITTCDQVVRPLAWRRGSSMPLRCFGPHGRGWNFKAGHVPLRLQRAKDLLNIINQNFEDSGLLQEVTGQVRH